MKIRSKLFVGFGAVILASVAMAVTGLAAIASLNANVDNLLLRRIPQVKDIALITEAIYSSAVHIDEAIMAPDMATANAELDVTASNRKATNEAMERLKTSLVTEEGKALFQAIIAKRTPYVALRDDLIKRVREGKQKEAHQGLPALKPLRKEFLEALKALGDHVQEQARLAHEETMGSARIARIIQAGMAAAALAVGLAAMAWIVRSFTAPLAEFQRGMDRLGHGDFTQAADAGSADEFGQMGQALNQAMASLRAAFRQLQGEAMQVASGSTELSAASDQMASASNEISGASEQQRAALDQVASALTQLSASIQQVSQNVRASRT
jgi:methyl-accepting chemotaxis protein